MHLLGYYISAIRGCCAMKFLQALAIDQGYLTHSTPVQVVECRTLQLGRGPPPKKKKN